jgi:sulfur carrier protein ThiS
MRIYLGGHLGFYHPQKEQWLEVKLREPMLLTKILDDAGIPLGEVQLVAINDEVVDLHETIVSAQDKIKLFSAVGGG